jgi:2-dehydro-3-deoxy-D-arabinonate dehydratase
MESSPTLPIRNNANKIFQDISYSRRAMKLYRTANSLIVEHDNRYYSSSTISIDSLLARDDIGQHLRNTLGEWTTVGESALKDLRAPIGSQEVWGAGVTYFKSRNARMAESPEGGSFYDRVYEAERPEIFFKATAHRVVGHNQKVAIRDDSKWSVPEPELALAVTPNGKIIGYTVANDMSSRDIEGENPLYLPQAKTYDRSCALGPAILVTNTEPDPSSEIRMDILRAGKTAFSGQTTVSARKRTSQSLVSYVYRHCSFPNGCFLMTGTGIIPEDVFTLQAGDEIRIAIAGVGTLTTFVG